MLGLGGQRSALAHQQGALARGPLDDFLSIRNFSVGRRRGVKLSQPSSAALGPIGALPLVTEFENIFRRRSLDPFLQKQAQFGQIRDGLRDRKLRILVKARMLEILHELIDIRPIGGVGLSHKAGAERNLENAMFIPAVLHHFDRHVLECAYPLKDGKPGQVLAQDFWVQRLLHRGAIRPVGGREGWRFIIIRRDLRIRLTGPQSERPRGRQGE